MSLFACPARFGRRGVGVSPAWAGARIWSRNKLVARCSAGLVAVLAVAAAAAEDAATSANICSVREEVCACVLDANPSPEEISARVLDYCWPELQAGRPFWPLNHLLVPLGRPRALINMAPTGESIINIGDIMLSERRPAVRVRDAPAADDSSRPICAPADHSAGREFVRPTNVRSPREAAGAVRAPASANKAGARTN